VTVAPALLAAAWLVPGIGMLLARRLLPVPMVIIFVPARGGAVLLRDAAAAGPVAAVRRGEAGRSRRWPAEGGRAGPGGAGDGGDRGGVRGVAGVVAV